MVHWTINEGVRVCSILFFTYVLPQVIFKPLWPAMLETFGVKNVIIYGQFSIHIIVYIIVNAFFVALYRGHFQWLQQFKTSPRAWPWENSYDAKGDEKTVEFVRHIRNALLLSAFNNVCLGLPLAALVLPSNIDASSPEISVDTFPTPLALAAQLAFFIFMEDLTFYWNHRLLHVVRPLYRHVHKVRPGGPVLPTCTAC
jgi:hypothetical protein